MIFQERFQADRQCGKTNKKFTHFRVSQAHHLDRRHTDLLDRGYHEPEMPALPDHYWKAKAHDRRMK